MKTEQGDRDSDQQYLTTKNPQPVSICKNLDAPNKLLPKMMIRSQIASHLLPLKTDLQAQSGIDMLLDDSLQAQDKEYAASRLSRVKNNNSKHRFKLSSIKIRSKSQINPIYHNSTLKTIEKTIEIQAKQQHQDKNTAENLRKGKVVRQLQQEKLNQTLRKDDLSNTNQDLDFLKGSLKKLLQFPQNIAFISKSAFISNLPAEKQEINQIKLNRDKSGLKLALIKYLKNRKFFGAVQYALDKNQAQLNLPDFPHTHELVFQDNFQSSNLFMAATVPKRPNEDVSCLQLHSSRLRQTHLQRKNHSLASKSQDFSENNIYLLTVRLDYNTKSYGQWFYFKVKRNINQISTPCKNMKEKGKISIAQNKFLNAKKKRQAQSTKTSNKFVFRIVNMTKKSSMFGRGLKISVCRRGVWNKQGTNISYKPNSLKREERYAEYLQDYALNSKDGQTYMTLQFTLQIEKGQEIYVAYNQPYTYTRLGRLVDSITNAYENTSKPIINFTRNKICLTPLNNSIQVLTFAANTSVDQSQLSQKQKELQKYQQKGIIVIMARTHPAQTAGSHVVQGILKSIYELFVLDPCEQKKGHQIYRLLQHYLIKIIPMVNPDGVILGNSRCNIAGYDLNRSWKTPHPQKCRETALLKKHILQFNSSTQKPSESRVQMFLDLHAHSKKKSVFAYGCHDTSDPYSSREFPFLLSKLSKKDFLFQQCRFTSVKSHQNMSKQGTSRVFMYEVLKIPNVFTIQSSYCSAHKSPFHYDAQKYQQIGTDILQAITLYFHPQVNKNIQQVQQQTNINQYQKEMQSSSIGYFSIQHLLNSNLRLSDTSNNKSDLNLKIEQSRVSDRLAQKQAMSKTEIRSKLLGELRADQTNVTMGLAQQSNAASQSQQQKRIYEAYARASRNKTQLSIKKHNKISAMHLFQKERQKDRNNKYSPDKPLHHTSRNIVQSQHPTQLRLTKSIMKHKYNPKNETETPQNTSARSRQQSVLFKKTVLNSVSKRVVTESGAVRKDPVLLVVEIGVAQQPQGSTPANIYLLNSLSKHTTPNKFSRKNYLNHLDKNKNMPINNDHSNFASNNINITKNNIQKHERRGRIKTEVQDCHIDQQIRKYMRRFRKPMNYMSSLGIRAFQPQFPKQHELKLTQVIFGQSATLDPKIRNNQQKDIFQNDQ